ncbi:16S rRNA (cytidine(1402)-2'-O)-methyltransferase [Alkalihalobacillus pseudalcaliphilus]|uniref:16S rRNA (cytidine(1402)-2'-O)-methyltransferase n=1 Tax=Alkalihalobacillus pseudalcaliphilus TaxID=79884 RepID=UPI00064DD881|nr:16S rRNA (cytidine(1402)-2'-O)-methyltransferase [Alkalihalobacillus pseudalcaliphilus]KMK74469.1 16S rRNA methyltransferase [Alkalihalobacillus pseudalcaliphilus]
MKEQKSFKENEVGTLYLVPTPIGNLEDMTYRAIRTLKEVDYIACEDTRQTKKLCHYFEIETKLISYHEHNKRSAGQQLIEKLRAGQNIAIVSDAGMPAISDPGYDLVGLVLEEENMSVVALPGANAALTSLIASGLPTEQFYFVGFLPRQKKQREESLKKVKSVGATLIFYEAPHRLKETLHALNLQLGDRKIVIARELTKKFEEYQRGTLAEAINWVEHGTVKGEFCLIVEGVTDEECSDEKQWWQEITIPSHVEHYIQLGLNQKDAVKQAAKDRGVPKREVYQIYHQQD